MLLSDGINKQNSIRALRVPSIDDRPKHSYNLSFRFIFWHPVKQDTFALVIDLIAKASLTKPIWMFTVLNGLPWVNFAKINYFEFVADVTIAIFYCRKADLFYSICTLNTVH